MPKDPIKYRIGTVVIGPASFPEILPETYDTYEQAKKQVEKLSDPDHEYQILETRG